MARQFPNSVRHRRLADLLLLEYQATVIRTIWMALPQPVKTALKPVRRLLRSKPGSELAFWRNLHGVEGGRFSNAWYEAIMLLLAQEPDQQFLDGKVVADFGCGPSGSLAWVRKATAIGIDLLVPEYADAFPDDIRSHGMIYVASTEKIIPLPSGSVDVLFTINALDHTSYLQAMCDELCRILKPGGRLCASFNLNEPATTTEPQKLTEEQLETVLLHRFDCVSRRFGTMDADPSSDYFEMIEDVPSSYVKGQPGYMWFNGVQRAALPSRTVRPR
jgi:SAM-dependent methyltransferase